MGKKKKHDVQEISTEIEWENETPNSLMSMLLMLKKKRREKRKKMENES